MTKGTVDFVPFAFQICFLRSALYSRIIWFMLSRGISESPFCSAQSLIFSIACQPFSMICLFCSDIYSIGGSQHEGEELSSLP